MKKLVASLSLALMAVSCGSKSTPLTAEQKTHFKETLSSLSSSFGATNSASNGRLSPRNPQRRLSAFGLSLEPDGTISREDATLSPAESQMAQSLSQCAFNINDGATSGSNMSGSLNMSYKADVNGAQCPIQLSLGFGMKQTGETELSMDFNIDYKALTPEFRRLSDVDGLHLSGSLKATGQQSGMGGTVSLGGDIGGTLHSQKDGDIKVTVNVDGNASGMQGSNACTSGEGSIKLRFEYPTYVAELETKGACTGGQMVATDYLLNGEKVSKDEFEGFFKRFQRTGGFNLMAN